MSATKAGRLTRGRKAAILVGLVIFIVGSSTAASYALWSTNATISGSGTAGTVGLTANAVASAPLAGLTSAGTGPGSTATTSVTVKNTGNLPMTYTTTLAATETPAAAVIGDNITWTMWVTASASNCTTAAAVGTTFWTGSLNTATTTLGVGRALAGGASEIYCVRTLMKTTAPQTVQGQSVAALLTFSGANS